MSRSIEVARTAHRVIAEYMATKPGENVVIVVDTRTSPSIPEMLAAAANLEFERAAALRDRIAQLKGQPVASPQEKKPRRRKRSSR